MKRTLMHRLTTGVAVLALMIGASAMAHAAGIGAANPASPTITDYPFDFDVGPDGSSACSDVNRTVQEQGKGEVSVSSISPSSVTYGYFRIAATSCDPLSSEVYVSNGSSNGWSSGVNDTNGESIRLRATTPANDDNQTTNYQGHFEA
jgi:hypothetical protein